jgi:nicotinamide-nucleotide amidase
MRAEIISIGDELLIGQTVNTNAAWMGQECSKMGIRIVQVTTISDDKEQILVAFNLAFKRADLILVTGGLGPTKDDITKYTLCEYFNTELEIHIPTLQRIESYFSQRNRPMLEMNIRQAEMPKICTILENKNGTANGMWFQKEDRILISMPGVPYEMKGIMIDEVFPRLRDRFDIKGLFHRTILTQGIGESFLADQIQEWENDVRSRGLGLAYLPAPGMVKLRLTSYDGEQRSAEIDSLFNVIKEKYPQFVFGKEEESLPIVVGEILIAKGMSIGSVESCTGGGLAESIVSIPGASAYFKGSFVTYSDELKNQLVGVSYENLSTFGAVSREVVEQMAQNGRELLGVDVCVSTSGIAGPEGGSLEKPVGTVWIAVAVKGSVVSKKFQFGEHRERNIQMTILTALNLVRCELLGILIEKK